MNPRLTIAAAAMAIVRDGTPVWLASSSIVAGPAASASNNDFAGHKQVLGSHEAHSDLYDGLGSNSGHG